MKWLKSMWLGFLNAFDLSPLFDPPKLPKQLNKTVEEALAEDWKKVGQDIKNAMQGFKNK